jgi:stage II sporulation protein D
MIEAVDSTRGQVMTYGGEIIDAVYFASSGGYTEDSENVWRETRPYLRAVSDPFETESRIWRRTFTLNELTSIVAANGYNIGSVFVVSVKLAEGSGRVQELSIHGTADRVTLEKEEIRNFFAYTAEGSLDSRNFTIESGMVSDSPEPMTLTITDGNHIISSPVEQIYGLDIDGTPNVLNNSLVVFNGKDLHKIESGVTVISTSGVVTFTGAGWGHGVGMSQRGAEGYAERGYGYTEILKHYYTGVIIE